MNARRRTFSPPRAWWTLVLVMTGLALASSSSKAQEFKTLVSFTTVWKYDRSGQELGPEWRTNDFDDSAWASGPGVLGFEDSAGIAQYMMRVPSGFGTLFPPPLSQVTTTYYFRTTFLFSGETNATQFFATNLVDDGCAIWLNGQLAGALRLPTNGLFNAATTAAGGPAAEGMPEVLTLRGELRLGLNQLAVEVHQNSPVSGDVAFAMHLAAVTAIPLTITNQPQSQNVKVGEPVTLTVGVSGGPVTYRWLKDGVNLPSTSNTVSIPNAQLVNAGSYRVICSNSLTVLTSSVATLSVFQDLAGPKVLEAIADNGFGVRGVNVRFSEAVNITSARNTSSYLVTQLNSGNTINVTNILYSVALGALLQLDENDPDWIPYGDYVLTINNVMDSRSNSIAPNTRVPILWPFITNLISGATTWEFHDIAVLDPGIYEERWPESDYIPGPWWGQGWGGFQGGLSLQFPCPYIAQPQVAMSYQPEPTLFRTSFNWPPHWPTNGTLRLRYGVDDGVVVFLNGREIHRYNAGLAGTPVTGNSRAVQSLSQAFCNTNVAVSVTNLLSGTNWIAVALLQSFSDQNSYFVFDLNGVATIGPELPSDPLPALQVNPSGEGRVSFSWSGHGYALETSTNLDLGPLSYPAGPWIEVPQMSNPYLWPLTNGQQHFFRLKK